MPLYEFRCKDCGKVVEELRKMEDYSSVECTDCKSEATYIMSTGIFEFKGEGFHTNDYPKPYDDFKDSSKGK